MNLSNLIRVPRRFPGFGGGPTETDVCCVCRRDFLKGSIAAGVGALVGHWADLWAAEALPRMPGARADQCILLWMGGGPTQMETWDPHPGHVNGGELKGIPTSVPGIQISETLPLTAREMKHISIIRSLSTGEGNHDRGAYLMHTGYTPSGTVKHPSLGAIVSSELKNPEGFDLPNFISIQNPSFGAGFLGVDHEPLVVNDPQNPIAHMRYDVSKDRFFERVQLLEDLDRSFGKTRGKEEVSAHDTIYKRTIRLIHSRRTREAFDLKKEPEKLVEDYSRHLMNNRETTNSFGLSCLLARKLLEAGVRFVEVSLGGWDMHNTIVTSVKSNNALLDQGLSTLVRDLRSKGMLERTLIVWMGEFGRTPQINSNAGRDHWARSWSMIMAGGGVNGGLVVGKTSGDGMDVERDPKTAPDVLATICKSLGIDPSKTNYSSRGRPIRLVPKEGQVIQELVS
ncbi:MAG: DUF1501 domain-containing protein [Planctomycetes bacterium]|nr:DUF1501 domain-containing protein [Planctomycetota bacterium]